MPIMQNRFGHIIAQCTDVVQIIEQWTSSGKVFIFGPLCLLFGKSPDIFTEMFARCRVIYHKFVCTVVQHSPIMLTTWIKFHHLFEGVKNINMEFLYSIHECNTIRNSWMNDVHKKLFWTVHLIFVQLRFDFHLSYEI